MNVLCPSRQGLLCMCEGKEEAQWGGGESICFTMSVSQSAEDPFMIVSLFATVIEKVAKQLTR